MPWEGRRIILDARPRRGGGAWATLATPEGGLEEAPLSLNYRAHLIPHPHVDPHRLVQDLEHATGARAWVEEWRKPPSYRTKTPLVIVEHPQLHELEQLKKALEQRGVACPANPLPPPLSEALHRHGAWPCHWVEKRGSDYVLAEDPGDPLYEPPPIPVARLTTLSWHGPRASPGEAVVGYRLEFPEGEELTLGSGEEALEALRERRVAVVMGRSIDLEALPRDNRGFLALEAPGVTLGFQGVYEWCRLSRLPLPQAARASIGQVLTSVEALVALEERMVLDPRAPRLEAWRGLEDLAAADRAGLVRVPRPGLYWGVVQLDFNSLYPTIIARYNLSGETVGPGTCQGGEARAPPGGIHPVCTGPRGVVARVLGGLVERRALLKKALSTLPRGSGWAEALAERADALKWILVSGFGYLGYRNSLFGSISAYENVTSIARAILARAEEVALSHGYRLVHSMVDSLMLQPGPGATGLGRLIEAIEEATGVALKLEARFTWLYIPPTLQGVGAANKYYGLLEEGGVKVRGVKAVRRDTPAFHARVQRRIIMEMARARGPGEMPGALERARRVLEEARVRLEEESVELGELVVVRRKTLPGVPGLRPRGMVERALVRVRGGWWPAERGAPPRGMVCWEYYLELLDKVARETPLGGG